MQASCIIISVRYTACFVAAVQLLKAVQQVRLTGMATTVTSLQCGGRTVTQQTQGAALFVFEFVSHWYYRGYEINM